MSRKRTKATVRDKGLWLGMNWIRQEKRLAIYLRDGLSCAYCGDSAEQGAQLSLDHIRPYSKGGSHHATNLITSCGKCNSSRRDKPLRFFASQKAISYIAKQSNEPVDVAAAKILISRRGSTAKVLNAAIKK